MFVENPCLRAMCLSVRRQFAFVFILRVAFFLVAERRELLGLCADAHENHCQNVYLDAASAEKWLWLRVSRRGGRRAFPGLEPVDLCPVQRQTHAVPLRFPGPAVLGISHIVVFPVVERTGQPLLVSSLAPARQQKRLHRSCQPFSQRAEHCPGIKRACCWQYEWRHETKIGQRNIPSA